MPTKNSPATHPAQARPTSMAEAVRIIMARDPEMDHNELLKVLQKEFKMHMSNKMAQNYRRTALEKLNHPARPARNGPAPAPKPEPASLTDELARIGEAMGWDKVEELARFAQKVRK